jgi:restriction system protein
MTLWMIRAGRYGEQEDTALNNSLTTIGWNELTDLSKIKSREELKELYNMTFPGSKKMAAANEVGQIWTFINKIKIGDLVALPLKTQAAVAIGKVVGNYEYRIDLGDYIHHARKVEWLRKDILRTNFDQDILFSLGAFMTVCEIRRNDAENRIKALLSGKKVLKPKEEEATEQEEESQNIEVIAKDQILKYVNRHFTGHELPILVEAILNAQGYITSVSKPGRDGGVDILAGSGALGFDNPKICVQVKSSPSVVDVDVFRSLSGTMDRARANSRFRF